MITHPVLSELALAGVKLGLDEIRDFLGWIGHPERAFPAVHVAGTNGKGSVCTTVATALTAAGLRTGLNTSPHLEHVNERVRVDGVPIDDDALDGLLRELDAARRAFGAATGRSQAPLTYFELTTALALVWFARQQVDVAVVEVGLGGRLDATGVVRPAVSAVTGIGLDHVVELGPDLASIAREKAGIFRPGVPAVVGRVAPEAAEVLAEVAARVGTPLWWVDREVTVSREPDGLVIATPRGRVGPVWPALAGAHQEANAAVSVGVLHQLAAQGWALPDEAVVHGLAHGRIAGRLEELAPGLVVDGAHNVQAAEALAAWLASRPRTGRRLLLWGMGEDRDPREVVAPLLPHVDGVLTTRCAHPKARQADALALALQGLGPPVTAGGRVEEALPRARAEADEVIVAGSLYLVGAVRALLGS
ncbi:MAG: bifunctional folylpolyglutamate synthase/dihydrofolate synthase [Alphaproteobacteria bacterium]|nr:bifunctional folylpolyglutamate synthase/dihydrofolate synthase [Alphaproteobacteria bacterium]